ncbi:C40 family peptidase [Streptomyces sp. 135]|uniref:C40 family peptidase n=1 Tax=Streptomyces sp. 135 TaxID=2838850 RepID=UPI001CBB6C5B|nr:C40 family peptidase [Streptomyces sp. 135]
MQIPQFTEDAPEGCTCGPCLALARTTRHRARSRRVRGALVAAAGAAVLVGAASGTASAEPAPSHAGWDGAKYWFRNSSGWWRWTSHYDVYVSRTGGTGTATADAPQRSAEPVFRGKQGWDATDGVYWFEQAGHWYWTSHLDVYRRHVGGSADSPSQAQTSDDGRAAGTPSRHGTEAAIAYAMAHLGDPYVWGGNGPHAWDCSGLVLAAYRQAGISLPRVADAQYRASQPIRRDQLRRGDLVFWSNNGRASGIHHVAIYLGNDQYLEAPHTGAKVRVSSFSWYDPNMYGRVS